MQTENNFPQFAEIFYRSNTTNWSSLISKVIAPLCVWLKVLSQVVSSAKPDHKTVGEGTGTRLLLSSVCFATSAPDNSINLWRRSAPGTLLTPQPWKSISRTTVLHSISRALLPLHALRLFDFFFCLVLSWRVFFFFLTSLFWCISAARFLLNTLS